VRVRVRLSGPLHVWCMRAACQDVEIGLDRESRALRSIKPLAAHKQHTWVGPASFPLHHSHNSLPVSRFCQSHGSCFLFFFLLLSRSSMGSAQWPTPMGAGAACSRRRAHPRHTRVASPRGDPGGAPPGSGGDGGSDLPRSRSKERRRRATVELPGQPRWCAWRAPSRGNHGAPLFHFFSFLLFFLQKFLQNIFPKF
jgi:hypothetical protein